MGITEKQGIIRDYYKLIYIYANKMDNLEEMEKFLEKYIIFQDEREKKRQDPKLAEGKKS